MDNHKQFLCPVINRGMDLPIGITPWYGANDFFSSLGSASFNTSEINLINTLQNLFDNYRFDHIEIRSEAYFMNPDIFSQEQTHVLNDFLKKNQISISIHLPYMGLDLASYNKHVRNSAIQSHKEIIEKTETLDPLAWVIHPTGDVISQLLEMPIPEKQLGPIMEIVGETCKKSILKLIELTNISPQKLALENTDFPFSYLKSVIDELDTSICFDTGHILENVTPGTSISQFLNEFEERISIVHLHDGNETEGSHKALGKYNPNFSEEILKPITERVTVPLVLEMNLKNFQKSMNYLSNDSN